MKTPEHTIEELIARQLDGAPLTDAERRELQEWLGTSEANRRAFLRAYEAWGDARLAETRFDTGQALENIMARIAEASKPRPLLRPQLRRLSIGIAVGIMLIGLAVFQLMTPQLLMLFQADADMLSIGVPALRIISLSFLFAGYCIIVGSVFQAMGNGVYSLIISVARQLVCILPLAYFFAQVFGLHAVWYSIPLAEITSVVLSSILFRKIYVEKIKPLGE